MSFLETSIIPRKFRPITLYEGFIGRSLPTQLPFTHTVLQSSFQVNNEGILTPLFRTHDATSRDGCHVNPSLITSQLRNAGRSSRLCKIAFAQPSFAVKLDHGDFKQTHPGRRGARRSSPPRLRRRRLYLPNRVKQSGI